MVYTYCIFYWGHLYISRFLSNIAGNSFYESKKMRKIFLYCLLLISLAGLFSRLAAQNITFKHLSTDNGLSQISVNDIYVDENNLIWIGTRGRVELL